MDKTELEMMLQIVQTQRATVQILADLVGKPSLAESKRQAQEVLDRKSDEVAMRLNEELARAVAATNKNINDQLKTAVGDLNKQVGECLGTVKKEAALVKAESDLLRGKQRYWESAVGNLQSEVAALIRRNGGDRDRVVFESGNFKG